MITLSTSSVNIYDDSINENINLCHDGVFLAVPAWINLMRSQIKSAVMRYFSRISREYSALYIS